MSHLRTIGLWVTTGALFLGLVSAAGDENEPSLNTAPYSFADFSWVPGNYGPSESVFTTKYFTPELRLDTSYHYSFSKPADHTLSGSSEVFRHGELQITQIGVGGDFNYKNVGFRLMTQLGMYSMTTPRNDASPVRGQWSLDNAYRYISEAYASYHLDVLEGINIQAGIFMSYVGLWSYYNFDNWTYQPSYVSSNTPWFFNGIRAQVFVNKHLKLEPWLVNGWQSYGMFNEQPGLGLQILWRPNDWISVVGNQYYGADTLGNPGRKRLHSDDSVMVKYHESKDSTVSKAAASLTVDLGCEEGGGVSCGGQYFLGFMAYNRLWFDDDHFGLTLGGGAIKNPGRYLVLVPPVNGANAATSFGSNSYVGYSNSPGDDFSAWDVQIAADYMPSRNITFRLEYNHRWASIPYFAGPGGMSSGGAPDLVPSEDRLTAAMMVRL